MGAMLLLFLTIPLGFSDMVRYDDHVVLRLSVNGSNPKEVNMYRHLRDNHFMHNSSFWSDRDLSVGPDNFQEIKKMLGKADIAFDVMIENVQALIDSEREQQLMAKQPVFGGEPDPNFFNAYRSYADHIKFIDDVVDTYEFATKVVIGNSYQNNPIVGVRVHGSTSSEKPGIYYECGIHSREWIAHTTCAYIMYKFATEYGKDERITKLVDEIEWTFVPVLNVDGYLYTWSNDRMWRKTRSPNSGSSCVGTDPNRNWDRHWCEVGASKNPCSESYCGSAAFTEACVRLSAEYVKENKNIVAFIDFHSYGQLWMRPYGYTGNEPADWRSQDALSEDVVNAIRLINGISYQHGSIYKIIYPASGSSADYIYDELNRKWPYGVELRDTGRYGFVLPANQIIPNGEEIVAGAMSMADYVLAQV